MTKPNNFILSTDYPTLKNDGTLSASGTISGSQVIASGSSLQGYVEGTIGQAGAIARGRIASTKNGTDYYTGQAILFRRTGLVGGTPTPYDVFAFMYRSGPTTLRFVIYIQNPYGSPLTTEAGDDIIYFYVNTFIAPFS